MADGLGYTPGTGSTVWTDDLGAAGHAQGVKVLDATDGSTNRWVIGADGAARFISAPGSTSTVSSVSAATTAQTLLAANAGRYGACIWNDSNASLYVKFGTGASTTSYTLIVGAGGYWESPPWRYTGAITGIWATSATGSARMTEVTA